MEQVLISRVRVQFPRFSRLFSLPSSQAFQHLQVSTQANHPPTFEHLLPEKLPGGAGVSVTLMPSWNAEIETHIYISGNSKTYQVLFSTKATPVTMSRQPMDHGQRGNITALAAGSFFYVQPRGCVDGGTQAILRDLRLIAYTKGTHRGPLRRFLQHEASCLPHDYRVRQLEINPQCRPIGFFDDYEL